MAAFLQDLVLSNLNSIRDNHSDSINAPPQAELTSRTSGLTQITLSRCLNQCSFRTHLIYFPPSAERDNRIRYFVINNRPNDALDLLERSLFRQPIMDSAAQKVRYLKLPPASVCNKVLDSAAHTKDSDLVVRAADLAGALQLEGIGVEPRTAQALIYGLASAGMVDRGIQLLDGWLSANAAVLEDDEAAQEGPYSVMTTLLEAAAQADDPDSINQVLLRMARVGFSPAPHTMTSLIQCFARLGSLGTAHDMLQWMRRSGMEPTAYSYAALMTIPTILTGTVRRTFHQKIKEAYDDMQANNVQPTAQFYAAYINALGRLRDIDAARDAWLDMEDAGVAPDLVCYNTMIDACAKAGDVEGAFHLYEDMQEKGVRPDGVAFATLISAVRGASDQARRVWNDMIASGIQPDLSTSSVFLEVLLKAGDTAGALSLLRDSVAAGTAPPLYEQAVGTAALRLQTRLVRSILGQMDEQGLPPTAHMVTSLLMARARKSSGVSRWRVHLDSRDPDEYTLHEIRPLRLEGSDVVLALVQAIESSRPAAKELLDTQVRNSVEYLSPDVAAILIGWHSAEGFMDEALDLYSKTAESMNGGVRGWVLTMLIAGARVAAAEKQAELVLKVVAEARHWSKAGSGWWFSQRTQKQIVRLLRRAPEAAGVLNGQEINENDGAMEARLRRLVRRKT